MRGIITVVIGGAGMTPKNSHALVIVCMAINVQLARSID